MPETETIGTHRRRAGLIWNGRAGRSDPALLPTVKDRLGVYFELTTFESGEGLPPDECARQAIAAGAEVIIAGGGDGTVSSVASQLIGTPIQLGILPCGTANSFAAGLAIPSDVMQACTLLATTPARTIDTARVDDRTMILHCSVGLHAATVGDTDPDDKSRWGILAYIGTGLRKVSESEPFALEMRVDDTLIRCTATAVTVANIAPTQTVFAQGPARISDDDGLLAVTVITARSLLEAIATGFHLFRTALQNKAVTRDNVGYLSVSALHIDATPAQKVLIDGENAGETPIMIECLPQSLHVIAPTPLVDVGVEPQEQIKLARLPDLEVEDLRDSLEDVEVAEDHPQEDEYQDGADQPASQLPSPRTRDSAS